MTRPASFVLRRPMAVALVLLGIAASISPARAADKATPFSAPSSPADEAAYRNAIRDGVTEHEAGRFEEARTLFLRAHELSPNARTFRGLGMTSYELRDYVAAVRNLTAALQDKRKPLSAEQRKGAQDLLDRSRVFVDVYTVKVIPSTARLVVDGRPAIFEPDGTILMGVNLHKIEASAPGMATRTQSVDVRGGASKELLLALEIAPPANSGLAENATTPSTGGPSRAALAWVLGGAGAAAVSIGASVFWYRQNSELNSCRAGVGGKGGAPCSNADTISIERDVAMGITIGAGVAALTMGVIGALTWKSGLSPTRPRSALACTPTPQGITCAGVF